MRWIIDWQEDHTVLRFEGDLVVGATQFFETGVTPWFKMPFTPIVLDLSDLKMIASAGLSELVKIHRILEETGVGLVIVKPSKEVWQSLVLTRLDEFFTQAESLEEAVEMVTGPSA